MRYEDFLIGKRREWSGQGVSYFSLPPSLYPFQAALTSWGLRKGRAAIFADTGLGKTAMQIAWAVNIPGRVLILAPLCVGEQTIAEGQRIGVLVRPHGAGGQIEITNYERLHQVDTGQYDGIVLDECFVAGTSVDTPDGPRPIEAMRVGDGVLNAAGYDWVVAVKERRLGRLVRLTLSDGRQVHCSDHHPFFSIRGLCAARMLKKGDYLYGTDEAVRVVRSHVLGWPGSDVQAILRSLLLSEMADAPAGDSRQGSCAGGGRAPGSEKERVAPLWRSEGGEGNRSDYEAESEQAARGSREDLRHPQGDGASADDPGRQRAWSDLAAAGVGGATRWGLVSRVRRVAWPEDEGLSDLLQGGPGEPIADARRRDRRIQSWGSPRRGREEGRRPGGAWVASVEILESRSPEFRAISGGEDSVRLYDLQVARHPSYSVRGLLVHNSSILKAYDGKTRTRLIHAFAETPYRLCCTATPAPNDIAELANHCEFLGIMTRSEMLATWFVHDEDGWRLKGHAHEAFYRWLVSWGIFMRLPSDLGFADDGYRLPG